MNRLINRREVLGMGVALGAGFAFGRHVYAAPARPRRPHIILCMADDMGWGDVGYQGHPRIKTPALDEMAQQSVRFNNFFAGSPVCSPTRATCLTGRHHDRSGVRRHSQAINPDEPTIADALADAGYATALFGKWHLHGNRGARFRSGDEPFLPDQLGFKHWFGTPNNVRKVDPQFYYENGEVIRRIEGEDSQIIMERALSFISAAARDDTPSFSCIWFHTPHTPHGSTDEFLEHYADVEDAETRAYYAQITAMDMQVGRLRAALREMGIADNTLLVFTSDNGANPPGSNGPYPGWKGKTSEGGNRVPGLIEWPAHMGEPFTTDAAMVTTDFYPTFAAAAGIESFGPDRVIDGENMLPLLSGERDHRRTRPIRLMQTGDTASVTPDGQWRKAEEDPGFADWQQSVEADMAQSLARIRELQGI